MNQSALIDTAKSYLEDMRRNSTEPDIRPTVIDFINRYGLGLPQIYGRSSKVTLPGVTKPVATTWTSLQAASELYPRPGSSPSRDNVASRDE